MEGKTKVLVTKEVKHCNLKQGMTGYIDGYCRGANDVPYAVVVCGEFIEMIPLHCLIVR